MDLIKEALADAKAVREIAKQNAISTLTEAFAPQMQSIVSRRLAEEEEEEIETDDEPMAEPAAPAPEAEPAPEPDLEDDADIDEVLAELEGELGTEEEDEYEAEDDLDEILREMEDEEMMEEEDDMASEEEVDFNSGSEAEDDLDEILREMEDEETDDYETAAVTQENRKLTRKLKEAYQTITKQKRILNEVGILNARLLYATKILGKYDLTESQKLKVLESLDRAKTLREAKLVFATITESLSRKKVSKSSNITEGASSRPIKAAARPLGSNEFVNKSRWQQLAGIKK